jgi:hypothetical protein
MSDQKSSKPAAIIALTIAAVCFLGVVTLQFTNVVANARDAALTEQSELEYIGPLHPTRQALTGKALPLYFAGEDVYFDTVRRVKMSGRPFMAVLITSSFQNTVNGLTYGQPSIAHVLDKSGTVKRQIVRRLPDDITPGTYVLIGWVKTETEKRPSFAIFESDPIEVESVPPK